MSITGKVSKTALKIEDKKSRRLHEEGSLGNEPERALIGENRPQEKESILTRGKGMRKVE